MAKKVAVLIAEGFEEIECAAPVDVLRRAGAEVTTVGVGAHLRKGAHGLMYQADIDLSQLKTDYDMVVLPGGMPGAKNLGESAAVKSLVNGMFRSGKLIAAICAAPVMTLNAWGLLEGKRATCYPGMESMFSPGVKFSSDRVVVDGNVTTSRGPGTALEFSLTLAMQLAGEAVAVQLAKDMLLK